MKKRKFNILLNIVALCLCITAIAIGVYSAKQASLNVSGSVGFNAHNCHVKITPYITGYKADGTKQTNAEQNIVELGKTSTDTTGNMELQELNFNDLNADGNVVTISLKIENLSAFDIKATISTPTIKNGTTIIDETVIKKEVKKDEIVLEDNAGLKIEKATSDTATNNVITITIILTALDLNNTSQEKINNSSFSMKIDFSKYVPPKQAYLAANWKSLIFTNENGNSNGICTIDNISKLVFTKDEPTGDDFVKNVAGETKTIEIGSDNLDVERELGKDLISSDVIDITVYAKSVNSKYEIYLYSPGIIYIGNKGDSFYHEAFDGVEDGRQFAYLPMSAIEWGNADFTKVTNAVCMFGSCKNLTSLDLTQLTTFDLSKVTDISGMFESCENLEKLDISNFDTSNATNIGYMFAYCEKLVTIYVSDKWTTEKVTNSGEMFSDCISLVGGSQTKYETTNPTDKTYARIDGGTSAPGYFTKKIAV